jgi:hypothetical protein
MIRKLKRGLQFLDDFVFYLYIGTSPFPIEWMSDLIEEHELKKMYRGWI